MEVFHFLAPIAEMAEIVGPLLLRQHMPAMSSERAPSARTWAPCRTLGPTIRPLRRTDRLRNRDRVAGWRLAQRLGPVSVARRRPRRRLPRRSALSLSAMSWSAYPWARRCPAEPVQSLFNSPPYDLRCRTAAGRRRLHIA
jgi:hypothetical protein